MNLVMKVFIFLLVAGFCTTSAMAQDEPVYITVTTIHWDFDQEEFSQEEWLATEKEYHEKVIMKNELIIAAEILNHYFTGDNSEIKIVTVYPSWEAIPKAAKRNSELAKAAWPIEAERDAFFKKQGAAYSNIHSDEIYISMPNEMHFAGKMEKAHVYYGRVTHLAFPEDGTSEEFASLTKEFAEKVTHKNKYIKGYYPHRHHWGADAREVVEVTIVETLADIANVLAENEKLVKAAWPDETARKAFFDKLDKYFTPWHGDFIYRNVPELRKTTAPPPVTNTVKNK